MRCDTSQRTGATRRNLIFAFLAAATLASALPQTAAAQDADGIVRKMVAVYKGARSIQETSESKIMSLTGKSVLQQTVLKYRAPNYLYLTALDPITGTTLSIDDGRTITMYAGKENIYTRRTSPSNTREVVTLIGNASEQSLGIRMSQVLSPISFVAARGAMPDEARSFTLHGTHTVDGHRCYQVNGQADITWVKSLAPALTVVPRKRDVFLWIDTKTFELVRSVIALTWISTLPGQPRGSQPKVPGGFAFEEAHRGTQINAPIPDSAFRFVPPNGAVEKLPHGSRY